MIGLIMACWVLGAFNLYYILKIHDWIESFESEEEALERKDELLQETLPRIYHDGDVAYFGKSCTELGCIKCKIYNELNGK